MHVCTLAAAAMLVSLAAAPAFAADPIDAETLKAIHAAATEGYADPAGAEIRDVRKSSANGGRGYCGLVKIEDMPDAFTTFHVILAGDGQPASALRLYDFGSPDFNARAVEAHALFRDYGCID